MTRLFNGRSMAKTHKKYRALRSVVNERMENYACQINYAEIVIRDSNENRRNRK